MADSSHASPANKGHKPPPAPAHTTLSTSTSSFEALDPHDPHLNHLASLMFSKSADWISGELEATAEEYELLEKMNRYFQGLSSSFFSLLLAPSFTHFGVSVDKLIKTLYSCMFLLPG